MIVLIHHVTYEEISEGEIGGGEEIQEEKRKRNISSSKDGRNLITFRSDIIKDQALPKLLQIFYSL